MSQTAQQRHLDADEIFGLVARRSADDEHLQSCPQCQGDYRDAEKLFQPPSRQQPVELPPLVAPRAAADASGRQDDSRFVLQRDEGLLARLRGSTGLQITLGVLVGLVVVAVVLLLLRPWQHDESSPGGSQPAVSETSSPKSSGTASGQQHTRASGTATAKASEATSSASASSVASRNEQVELTPEKGRRSVVVRITVKNHKATAQVTQVPEGTPAGSLELTLGSSKPVKVDRGEALDLASVPRAGDAVRVSIGTTRYNGTYKGE